MRSTPGRPSSLHNEQVLPALCTASRNEETGEPRPRGSGFAWGAGGADLLFLPWPCRQATGAAASRKAAHPRHGDAGRQAEGMPPGVKADGRGGPPSALDPATAAPLGAKGQKRLTQS